MTTYSIDYLVFLISFIVMIIDGKIEISEMEYNRNIYIENTTEQDMDYQLFANELLKQVNQYETSIIESLITSIPISDLTNAEKEAFLKQAFNTAKSDGEISEEEKNFLIQLKKELNISDKLFLSLTSPHISENSESTKSLQEYLKDVSLPEFEPFN